MPSRPLEIMTHSHIACVTGANKGIGYGIVRQLALQYPKSHLGGGSLLIYLTARDHSRGQKALTDILQDQQLTEAKVLTDHGGVVTIQYHQLDVSDHASIHAFRDHLAAKHKDGLDIVIHNAGVALQGFNSQVVRDTLACNYYGTIALNEALLPLMRDNGRVVNVSSTSGKLSNFATSIAQRFRAAKSVQEVTSIMEAFQDAVDQGCEREAAFPSAAYGTSKAGVTAVTRVFAEKLKQEGKRMLMNSCHPGYVNTDMTKGRGVKTIDEGARTPVLLALSDIGGVSGAFWSDEKVIDP